MHPNGELRFVQSLSNETYYISFASGMRYDLVDAASDAFVHIEKRLTFWREKRISERL